MNARTIRLPRLHDHHSHPLLYASFNDAVCLESVTEKAAARQQLETAIRNRPPQHLTLAYGWRSNLFSWHQDELDALGNVAIFNLSLHQLCLSQSASVHLSQRFGNEVSRVGDGLWYEQNFRTVLNWFANLNASADSLIQFYQSLESLGVGSCEELLLVDQQEINLFQEAGLIDRTRFWASPDTFESLNADARKHIYGLKLFTDGAFGARTAAVSRPYLTGSTECPDLPADGLLMYSDLALQSQLQRCLSLKPKLAIHAIGDRAIEQTIEALERISLPAGNVIRIEHAQLINLEQARRAKSLGVTLSMQPNFNSDSKHYVDRLPKAFCDGNNPFRMLIDQAGFVPGDDLIFGSDGMPHGLTRAAEQCFVACLPSQRLTPEEFVAAYTSPDFSHDLAIEMKLDPQGVTWRWMNDS